MALDEFNTPPHLAEKIVQIADLVCDEDPKVVADFAVGTGELLAAAKLRWPRADIFGCDINDARVTRLAKANSDWKILQCDFLDVASRIAIAEVEMIKAGVDLVVLNPPFSARGGTKVTVHVSGQEVCCSPAMAFVLVATQYLNPNGKMVVLLPAGVPHADRDQEARTTLRELGEFLPINETTGKFPGGSLKVTIAYFKRGPATDSGSTPADLMDSVVRPMVKVLRGTLQTHKVSNDEEGASIPLVHSTELRNYKLQFSKRRAPSETRSLNGPAVLIHRVGQPRKDKIAFVPLGPSFAITDCVVALICSNEHECIRLHRALTDGFDLLEENYVGSGAPYITIRRIRLVLNALGFASRVVSWREKNALLRSRSIPLKNKRSTDSGALSRIEVRHFEP